MSLLSGLVSGSRPDRCDSFVDRDMLMRYLGGGIGHGGHLRLSPTFSTPVDLAASNDRSSPRSSPATSPDLSGSESFDSAEPSACDDNPDSDREAEDPDAADENGYDSDVPFALL